MRDVGKERAAKSEGSVGEPFHNAAGKPQRHTANRRTSYVYI
jgi:hypothetical protein